MPERPSVELQKIAERELWRILNDPRFAYSGLIQDENPHDIETVLEVYRMIGGKLSSAYLVQKARDVLEEHRASLQLCQAARFARMTPYPTLRIYA